MSPFLKVSAAFALLLAFSSASSCAGGLCVEPDETSLLQKFAAVEKGKAAQPPVVPLGVLGEVDPESRIIASRYSASDGNIGILPSAYDANMDKGENAVIVAANIDAKLNFDKEVADQRRRDKEAAAAEVRGIHSAVDMSIEADRANVEKVETRHIAVEKAAAEQVHNARVQYEAHDIKKHEAEHYAVQGRLEGVRRGEEVVARKIHHAAEEAAAAAAQRLHEEEVAAAERRREEQKAAVNAVTKRMNAEEQADVNEASHVARHVEVDAAADAADAKVAIEGPEAMGNAAIFQAASDRSHRYNSASESAQHISDEAASGKFP